MTAYVILQQIHHDLLLMEMTMLALAGVAAWLTLK